jgi:hypothetical protein
MARVSGGCHSTFEGLERHEPRGAELARGQWNIERRSRRCFAADCTVGAMEEVGKISPRYDMIRLDNYTSGIPVLTLPTAIYLLHVGRLFDVWYGV